MKTQELISKLQALDPEAEVVIQAVDLGSGEPTDEFFRPRGKIHPIWGGDQVGEVEQYQGMDKKTTVFIARMVKEIV